MLKTLSITHMKLKRFPLRLLFVAIAALSVGEAAEPVPELQFEDEIVHIRPDGEPLAQIPARFKFRNQSNRQVNIVEVASCCSCTKATPANSVIEPGDVSEITVRFDGRGRESLQRKRLVVRTDRGDRIILTLVIELPSH